MIPQQTMFREMILEIKAWYLAHYGVELKNNKIAEQITIRCGRRAYYRTICAIEAGKMPAWDFADALRMMHGEWVLCRKANGVDETKEIAA